MPTFDEAILRHAGAKFFTKLDARHGYWSLVLDEESSQLTTFNTPYSCYKFKRMPFGLISAQDEFQRCMEEAFEGIQGFSVIVDDIIISGKTIEEHDANVRSALIRAREKGVKLNLQKCVFKCNSIPYFGHVISENGIHPDPQKVRALREMRTPNTKDELQTILGMMNYLARYIPNLSSINQPLRDLVKQQQFKWKQQHDKSFTNIKESICSSLAFFDPTAGNVELQVDASKFGLGTTLSQNGKPISFASRSLNSTEQNYSQIEKELYAILFGCIHFHQYLYGRKFTVVSDHKPLQVVLNRPISKSSPRLQRMLLRIQPYDLIIAFRPGKEIPVADALVDVNPRSYIIETTNGGTYQRNRQHIKTLNQQPQSPDLADHEEDSPEAKTSPAPISPPSIAPVPPVTPIETLPQPINFECSSTLRTLPPASSTSRPAQEEPQNSPYITRSGRLVKPIQRMDM
ncbi:hypothetical protein QYM36_002972 [Artemia franciscana]|uniref:Reverse transcriptase domain-containing protein n=1 Tax=Artemia franciscana TaxID=6661 RepID=A0AA88IJ51_ARTSF|nr:hypothetical protein QYM36_002972 [Artemia franciscana]KAK2722617.1 hypothetical protein QYM36_002972 [Artemia franciscana]